MSVKLKDLESIESVLSEMTIEEKATLVIGGSPMSSVEMKKYGIPRIWTSDCCNGLNTFQYTVEKTYRELEAGVEDGKELLDREELGIMGGLLCAVGEMQKRAKEAKEKGVNIPDTYDVISYPTGISQASTWNPDLAEECARSVAKEFIKHGIDLILSPNINIHRDPLCGRLSESYSEDPYLVSRVAESVVKGLQDEGIIANPKHFAANSQEKDRLCIDEKIPMRALREIYLPGFKACVDAGALTVMSAYNKINGESCAMNKWLLKDVLKDEWKFDGCVISDWGASYEQIPAIEAGTDLTMPGPRGIQCIIDAVNNGSLDEEDLNDACRRILRVIVKGEVLEKKTNTFDIDKAKDVVERAAQEGMILLKNNGALPTEHKDANICFYGQRAKKFAANSDGSGRVPSNFTTNPYDCAVNLLGEEKVSFEQPSNKTNLFVAVVGADGQEGADRLTMDVDECDKESLKKAIEDTKKFNGKLILVCNSSGPITLTEYIDDCDAILCPYFAGQAGGKAVVDAIFGFYNPSGKLTDTWPKEYKDTPAFKNFGGENKEVWYGEGIYVGYRWYDARGIEPLFPFGFGLSYTTFEISDLEVKDTDIEQTTLNVKVKVKNTGNKYGAEVVQLYVASPESELDKPEKELKGFQKVFLEPGEIQEIIFNLTKEELAHYHTGLESFITEKGDYGIMVGSSSRDISVRKTVTLTCNDPFGWSVITGIGKLVSNKKVVEIINQALQGNVMEICSVPIQYAPDRTLKEIWEDSMIEKLFESQGRTKEDMKNTWKWIQNELKKID
ncbi:MAG: glycoside hydrolase family 3 C-terminal domain-containing protein [Lachnospiraceae bacterium]|nr:glycoside hydrolase family 3 C-terminal domain-containing protein [Lachnospiraceae bacterium]